MNSFNYNDFYTYLCNRLESVIKASNDNRMHAIMFDIDGTIINTTHFNWEDHIAIQPVYNFYKYCLNRGINIFIVTARSGHKSNMEYTIDKIQNHLRLSFNQIYFRNPDIENVHIYKQQCRDSISMLGYQIHMSIGDNLWDIGLNGGIGIHMKDDPISCIMTFNEYIF